MQARQRQGSEGVGSGNGLLHGLRMLSRSRLFMKLTACVMLTGIVMEGMYELLAQYFQLKLGYTAQDQVQQHSCFCILHSVVDIMTRYIYSNTRGGPFVRETFDFVHSCSGYLVIIGPFWVFSKVFKAARYHSNLVTPSQSRKLFACL